ncbi:LysR substrate-binding domain-containing protein [Bordetella tumulicola]|uniref:LysR substrate-binding domain-containing protein n=1 Tax=Bordetella tumulicola TaxID=1649133 RepID=UPI0039F14999
MELRQLRYFVKTVELGSLSRAAEAVHVAQSALSSQIARLEEELGCQLLSRSSRGAEPTEHGMQLYRRARAVLQQIEGMRDIGGGIGVEIRGKVTLGLPVSVAQTLATELFEALTKRCPHVLLRVIEYPSSYLAEQLLNHRIDVALLFAEDVPRGVDAQAMIKEDFYAIGVPAPAEGDFPLTALDGVPLILAAQPNNVRAVLDRACYAAGLTLNVVVECSNPLTMLRLARSGVGATVLPLSALPDQASQSTLPTRLITPRLQRVLALCTAIEAPQEPALLALRGVLSDLLHDMLKNGRWPGGHKP